MAIEPTHAPLASGTDRPPAPSPSVRRLVHVADYYGAAESTIGAVAIGLTIVLLILTCTAGGAYARSTR